MFNRGIHALYQGGPGREVLRSLGIEPQGSSPPLARYQALAGGELHLLPTSPDSLRRTTLLGRKDKEALAALLARLPRLHPQRHADAAQVMAVTSKDGVIISVYFVGNPDKLTSVGHSPFIE